MHSAQKVLVYSHTSWSTVRYEVSVNESTIYSK
jgi:hypothetical protein